MDLKGIFPPLTVPFASDGSVDHGKLRSNIERYNATRLAGYVLNGSTGESVLLRWTEIYEIWETAKKAAARGKILIAGSGAESTAETIEHTNRAAALGYDFALVRTPSYYKPLLSLEVEAEHYLRVAEAAKIPVLLYSVPAFTGYAIEASLLARVASHRNIAGLKDSSGNVERVSEFVAVAPNGFRVLVGSAATLAPSLEKGAAGGILAMACAFPDLCCEIYEATLAGDRARAEQLQQNLSAPSAVISSKYGIPGLKYALDQIGYAGGLPRPPLLPIGAEAKREIDGVLAGVATLARTGD
ncbi:MAG: dihydrodipicolinate synthase family protein [Candidatus Acidiferrales bacterium]